MGNSDGKEVGEELWEETAGKLPQIGSGPGKAQGRVLWELPKAASRPVQWGLGLRGAGRMAAALLLHLLLINNVFGARTQLLCLLRTAVESASLQQLGNVGAPGDLAAASEFVPKDQRSIFELSTIFTRRLSTWGRSSSSIPWLRDEGVGFRKSGLQILAIHGFFLSHGGARVESADFGTCLAGCGAVWALVLKIVLAPESKTKFWCLLFKPLVGFQWLFPCGI